jgi:hypothetical protein
MDSDISTSPYKPCILIQVSSNTSTVSQLFYGKHMSFSQKKRKTHVMIHSFSMENKGHDSQFFNENHRSGLRNIYSSNSESYNKSTVGPCTLLFSSKKK